MNLSTDRRSLSPPTWLVWALALAVTLFGLDGFALLDNNEGLYAAIPRDMLVSGDWRAWVIPHLNGLPYMEKPPLLYWLVAGAFAIFGQAPWVARLVPALSALGCVAMLLWLGRETGRPAAARVGALFFISGLGVMAMSHVLMFDMLLTFLLTAALAFAWRFVASDADDAGGALRWAYAFLALAVLAKGLVALVLFGLVVLGHSLLNAQRAGGLLAALFRWLDWRALAVFFAIAAPWHVAAALVEPSFAWFYFINEHVLRFLGQREPHDYYAGPWWYYLPRMAIYLFPWSFLLPCLLTRRRDVHHPVTGLDSFLLLAWLMPLLFFSVSSAKANYYLVAVMPFAAFQLAMAVEARGWFNGFGRAFPGILVALLNGALAVTLVVRGTTLHGDLQVWHLPLTHFVLLAQAGTALLGAAAALLAWRAQRIGILAYLGLPAWTLALLLGVLEAMEPTISTSQVARYARTELPGFQVMMYRDFEQLSSLPFYQGAPLQVVDMRSNDLYWGDRLRPGNAIAVTAEDFAGRARSERLAIVVADRHVQDFRAAPFFAAFAGEKRIGNNTVFHN